MANNLYNQTPPQEYLDQQYKNSNTMFGNMTPGAMSQLDFLTKANAQGALDNNSYNELVMNLIMGNPRKQAEEEARQRALEDSQLAYQTQQQNLGLGQAYNQLGDPVTAEYYNKQSLPSELKSKINKRTPGFLEKLLAALSQYKPNFSINPLEGVNTLTKMKYGYNNPDLLGYNKATGQSDLDYLGQSSAFGTPNTALLQKGNAGDTLSNLYGNY
jgi:hypothetical protein